MNSVCPEALPEREFDPTVPNAARVYNVWLDGKDHFESDRAVADQGDRAAAPGRRRGCG